MEEKKGEETLRNKILQRTEGFDRENFYRKLRFLAQSTCWARVITSCTAFPRTRNPRR